MASYDPAGTARGAHADRVFLSAARLSAEDQAKPTAASTSRHSGATVTTTNQATLAALGPASINATATSTRTARAAPISMPALSTAIAAATLVSGPMPHQLLLMAEYGRNILGHQFELTMQHDVLLVYFPSLCAEMRWLP